MSSSADHASWWDLAACQRVDPELFFPVSHTGPAQLQEARAKAVCAQCVVRTECLDYAMATHQVHGVWGGLGENERRKLRASRLQEVVVSAS
ncbi:MAG TPA: WhiB family transcriptional regulator [Streptosporangiaceae bacterium]|nr:WhiB family transcriptional regulator [Streptosporangiaceae bacterium]